MQIALAWLDGTLAIAAVAAPESIFRVALDARLVWRLLRALIRFSGCTFLTTTQFGCRPPVILHYRSELFDFSRSRLVEHGADSRHRTCGDDGDSDRSSTCGFESRYYLLHSARLAIFALSNFGRGFCLVADSAMLSEVDTPNRQPLRPSQIVLRNGDQSKMSSIFNGFIHSSTQFSRTYFLTRRASSARGLC